MLAQRDVWGCRRSAATGLAPLDLRRLLTTTGPTIAFGYLREVWQPCKQF